MRLLAALILCFGMALPAGAATISAFSRTANDGVYSLSKWQKSYFGITNADYIGFVRARSPQAQQFSVGDTFSATTAANSVTSIGSAILGYLNGTGSNLTYTGNSFDPLGQTTITRRSVNLPSAFAFLFSANAGTIQFAGNTSFNASQSQGPLNFTPPPVPLPAGLPLLAGALAALGAGAAWRRRATLA